MIEVASSRSATSKREEDLNIIVELVWLDLQGTIARNVVRQTVSSIIEEYDGGKVRNLLSVLIQRKAKKLLLQELSGE